MSTVGLSRALAKYMREIGATTIEVELLSDEAGDDVWSAAIVHDDHLPHRQVKVFEASDEYPMVWQPLYQLADAHRPLQEMDEAVDWGRLGDAL
jgi:hypothetical protein